MCSIFADVQLAIHRHKHRKIYCFYSTSAIVLVSVFCLFRFLSRHWSMICYFMAFLNSRLDNSARQAKGTVVELSQHSCLLCSFLVLPCFSQGRMWWSSHTLMLSKTRHVQCKNKELFWNLLLFPLFYIHK